MPLPCVLSSWWSCTSASALHRESFVCPSYACNYQQQTNRSLLSAQRRILHTNPIPDSLSVSPAARRRSSVIPISECSVSAMMDKTDPAHTHTHTHTHTKTHKRREEAPMMAVTGRQSGGSGPAVLWEMTLFGPIKVRLCVDTSIHMIIAVWGIPSVFTAFKLRVTRGHTHTHTHTPRGWPVNRRL